MSEHDLVHTTCDLLNLHGVWCVRNNTGRGRGGKVVYGLGKGGPDLLALDRGRVIALEAKGTHKDGCICASCEDQRGWALAWQSAGGSYAKFRTPEQARDFVVELRKIAKSGGEG